MKKRFIERIKDATKAFYDGTAPMSGGNKFEVGTQLRVQKELDLQTAKEPNQQLKNSITDIDTMTSSIRRIGEQMVREKNIEPYFLLQMQADYFCNTCKFKTEDILLKKNIINIIRGAFFMGTAGMYKNEATNMLEPVYVTELNYGLDGNLRSCKILPLATCLQKMNETQGPVSDANFKGFRTLNEKQCENVALFSWGTMGYSCWIKIWPFIKLQHMMLTIIIINGFVFNKKWIYKLNTYSSVAKEIELFFNPNNPFIVNVGNTEDLSNRISTEEGSKAQNTADVIDYYNKMLGVYYQLIGRKINNDYKKERNISNEVEASQENYDVVQNDWLAQFEIFIMQLKKLGCSVEYVNEQEEQKKEQQNESNKDNTKPNTGNK